MSPLLSRSNYLRALACAVSDPSALAQIHADTEVPADIGSWLNRLTLLCGVPFAYLVPQEAMLLPESIGFFALDASWSNALLEGACSIGRATSADQNHDAALAHTLHDAANPAGPVTGFLLRSALVSGWPGLEVTAYDKDGNVLAPQLRMERLAPTVLLYLVEGIIARVDIHEPAEGLHFGTGQDGSIQARYITLPTKAVGKSAGDAIDGVGVAVGLRDPHNDTRVVKIAALAGAIAAALQQAGANNNPDGSPRAFTSAEFAAEMVEGVQLTQLIDNPTIFNKPAD
jgi:hypothetical protein